MSDVYYCVAGAKIFCNHGTHFRRLDLPLSHGVYIRDKAAVNERDREFPRNVPAFGVCLSRSNNGSIAQTSDPVDRMQGSGTTEGRRCVPHTAGKWINAKADKLVDGRPALTVESTLTCSLGGGVIAFADNGQGVG